MTDFLKFSMNYLDKGLNIIPLLARDKKPAISWDPYKVNRVNKDDVQRWWTVWPNSNIGCVTGSISDIIVLDLDNENAHTAAVAMGLPETWKSKTGKGYHIFFKYPGTRVKNYTRILPGMDIKADGGYVVLPPSIHPSGATYQWIVSPDDQELAVPPDWLMDLIQKLQSKEPPNIALSAPDKPNNSTVSKNSASQKYAQAALEKEISILRSTSEGERNNQLNKSAYALGQLVAAGLLQESEVVDHLTSAALRIGLSESEISATIRSGLSAGMHHPRDVPESSNPYITKNSNNDPNRDPPRIRAYGENGVLLGVTNDGTVKRGVVKKNKNNEEIVEEWVSDCAVFIKTETRSDHLTEFKFCGRGAIDGRTVEFTLPSEIVGDPRKFRIALINEFGANNKVGRLDFETVQKLSLNVEFKRRIEIPIWYKNVPLIPGLDLRSDIEFRLSPMTPARVQNGDINIAKKLLSKLFKIHPLAPVLVTAILGAPATARWLPDERIGVALWGTTGTQKTTTVTTCMAVYGEEYLSERFLLKQGHKGSTTTAASEIFASAGILPQILDNVKGNERDLQEYVALIHTIIEGSSKQRGKKDGGVRESKSFMCTPIITGESRPAEASTSARICNLNWSAPDLQILSELAAARKELPFIGYHWLKFLSETDLNPANEFYDVRAKVERTLSMLNFTVNTGRLASICVVLCSIWKMLYNSPFRDVIEEHTADFINALTSAIIDQAQIVKNETDVERFINGLRELIRSVPYRFEYLDKEVDYNEKFNVMKIASLGRREPNGDYFILPMSTIEAVREILGPGQILSEGSLGEALKQAGYLVKYDKDRTTTRKYINHAQRHGWLIDGKKLFPQSESDSETDDDSNNMFDDINIRRTIISLIQNILSIPLRDNYVIDVTNHDVEQSENTDIVHDNSVQNKTVEDVNMQTRLVNEDSKPIQKIDDDSEESVQYVDHTPGANIPPEKTYEDIVRLLKIEADNYRPVQCLAFAINHGTKPEYVLKAVKELGWISRKLMLSKITGEATYWLPTEAWEKYEQSNKK